MLVLGCGVERRALVRDSRTRKGNWPAAGRDLDARIDCNRMDYVRVVAGHDEETARAIVDDRSPADAVRTGCDMSRPHCKSGRLVESDDIGVRPERRESEEEARARGAGRGLTS